MPKRKKKKKMVKNMNLCRGYDVVRVSGYTYVTFHYTNISMQYTAIFHGCKNGNFQLIFFVDYFHIFAQNIDCGYTLEPPQ